MEILSPHFRTNEMNQLRQRRHTLWAATTVCPGKRAFFSLEDGGRTRGQILDLTPMGPAADSKTRETKPSWGLLIRSASF